MSADTLAERIRELTTKAGKFLTSEHRRKYDHGKECLACSGIAVPVPTEEDMAAFALSELSAAEKAERERCCADVCHHCRSKSDKYITRAKKVDGKWIHEEVGFEKERGGFDCYAASIRNRE